MFAVLRQRRSLESREEAGLHAVLSRETTRLLPLSCSWYFRLLSAASFIIAARTRHGDWHFNCHPKPPPTKLHLHLHYHSLHQVPSTLTPWLLLDLNAMSECALEGRGGWMSFEALALQPLTIILKVDA